MAKILTHRDQDEWPPLSRLFLKALSWMKMHNFIVLISLPLSLILCLILLLTCSNPDSNAHGAHMGPIWGRQTQVGPMLAPWTLLSGKFSSAVLFLPPSLPQSLSLSLSLNSCIYIYKLILLEWYVFASIYKYLKILYRILYMDIYVISHSMMDCG